MLTAASHDCHPAMPEVKPALFDGAGFRLEDPTMHHLPTKDLNEIHADR